MLFITFLCFLHISIARQSHAQQQEKNQAERSSYLSLKGMPEISHYSQEDFHAEPQFWAVCEDQEGVLYFGNNDGAVVFDGERWHKLSLPNNSSIRSLATDKEGNVYAGGFNELGQISKNDLGQYYYKSLLDTLQLKGSNFENLWKVHVIDNLIVFRSFSNLIVISDETKVTKLPASSSFISSFVVNDQLFVYDQGLGIMLFDPKNMQLHKQYAADEFEHEEIITLLASKVPHEMLGLGKSGKLLVFDQQTHQVRYLYNVFSAQDNDQIICAIKTAEGQYLLGTLSSNIITLNEEMEISSQEDGFHRLQDKTVLGLFQNNKGNVWALLNNGLDRINFNSPVSRLFDNASIYDLLLHEGKMYVATNQGVYLSDSIKGSGNIAQKNFHKINELEGQAWSIQKFQEDVLVSHDNGLYHLKGAKGLKIEGLYGIWKVIPVAGREGFYFAASYHGLHLVQRTPEGVWENVRKISGFDESSRDILADKTPGTYWICHGYKGVYRIKINKELDRVTALEHFTTQNGLPSPFNINVFKWQGETVFTTNQGVYTYQQEKNEFMPFKPLNSLLDTTQNTRKLLQTNDKTWFVQDDEAGYFTNDQRLRVEKESFLQFKGAFNRGMECIIPLNSQQVLFGTKAGLYLFDLSHSISKKEVSTNITSVRYTSDQQESYLPISLQKTSAASLPTNTSQLRFEFAAPGMQSNAGLQYSYRLENMDTEWSPWQKTSFIEFNHLRSGMYTFKVKSRNLLGMNGKEASYFFEILPVWYQTSWALALFLLLGISLVGFLVYFISRKITLENIKARKDEEKARKLLELEIEQMKLQAEKEIIREEKELLQEDIINKSKELANYTMLLVKKREVLLELHQDMKELREAAKSEISRKKARESIKKISAQIADEEHLKVFEINFEKVHHDFFTKLKGLYPDLNQRDLQLCAFVKMNLSNKEISPLLNISVRGVETARYRLRKKLNLEHDHNFVEYLENLSPTAQEPL